ncbi:T9SS type A sorting domain-containing protein [Bacteroidota bacterium]
MKKQFSYTISIVTLSLILSAWGGTGHYKISEKSALSFNPEMHQFMAWAVDLAEHASDADARKSSDPDESVKHYIDIDNYPEFIANRRIPHSWDSVIDLHGYSFVDEQGILPWATLASYDSLVACFGRRDWDQALLFASDLGHYVADGHMPLHITRNYNGQYTGNNGIHSRYESSMISDFISEIEYTGETIEQQYDILDYIFRYLYTNYKLTDSILIVDDFATSVAGNTSSSAYYTELWKGSEAFTIQLFKSASHALAELIYSAWLEAGSPSIDLSVFGQISTKNQGISVWPNPANSEVYIEFEKKGSQSAPLMIVDLNGDVLFELPPDKLNEGFNRIQVSIQNIPDGIYLLSYGQHVCKFFILGSY